MSATTASVTTANATTATTATTAGPAPLREAPMLVALRAGLPQYMLGVRSSRTAEIVRIAKSTGYHSVMIDLEHSSMSVEVAAALCGAASDLGLTALVRVPEREYGMIGRLLDSGAHGIVAARVETAEEASIIAEACRFPPLGHRSQLSMVPAFGMVPTVASTLNPAVNGQTILKVLIESPKGVANAAEIADVPGVDILGIGANDYTSELGAPGDYRDARFVVGVSTVVEAARDAGKLSMVGGVGDPSIMGELMALGLSPMFLTGMDTDVVFQGARERVERMATWYTSLSDAST